MSIGLIAVKAVGSVCNLQCHYCYTKTSVNNIFMSERVLEQTIKSIALLNPLPIFFWGGGEPLLFGMNSLERALNIQTKYLGHRFINSLQTNGMLVDRTWIGFLKRYNFQVGISWDGFMSTSRGESVSGQVWKNMKLCLSEKLHFGVITVVTKENIDYLLDIARFLYSNGIKNLLFKPYIGPESNLSLNPIIYAETMCKLLDLWMRIRDNNWILEPIRSFVAVLSGKNTSIVCELAGNCGDFLTIEPSGDISCCDFISQRIVFGNIFNHSIDDIINGSDYFLFLSKTRNGLSECSDCSWRFVCCNRGCLHYRNYDDSTGCWGKSILCEPKKRIFSHCKQKYFV